MCVNEYLGKQINVECSKPFNLLNYILFVR